MSAPLPQLRMTPVKITKFDQCANALRAIWIAGDGVMSRAIFNDTCRDRDVDPAYMQAVFEGMEPFRVEHDNRDNHGHDRFVFPIYSEGFLG